MSIETAMLQQRIKDLESQILHIKSTLLNVICNIKTAAEEENYDEIIEICERFDPE